MAAKRAPLDVVFRKYCADFDSKLLLLQTILENETNRADEEHKERKWLVVDENVSKSEFGYRADDSDELESLQYKRDGSIAKDRRSQNTVMSFQGQLSSLQSVVEDYRHCLIEYAERFTASKTASFSVFQCGLLVNCQTLANSSKRIQYGL